MEINKQPKFSLNRFVEGLRVLISVACNQATYAATRSKQERIEELFLEACSDLVKVVNLLEKKLISAQAEDSGTLGDTTEGVEVADRYLVGFIEKLKQIVKLKPHPVTIDKLRTDAHRCLRQVLPVFPELYSLLTEKLSTLDESTLEKLKGLCWQISGKGGNPLFFIGFPRSVLSGLEQTLASAFSMQTIELVSSQPFFNTPNRLVLPFIAGSINLALARSSYSLKQLANNLHTIWMAYQNLKNFLLKRQIKTSDEVSQLSKGVSIADRLQNIHLIDPLVEGQSQNNRNNFERILQQLIEPVESIFQGFLQEHTNAQLELMASQLENLKQLCIEQFNAKHKNFQRGGPEARVAGDLKNNFLRFLEKLFAPIIQNQPRYFGF
jgi:hypothetical protein